MDREYSTDRKNRGNSKKRISKRDFAKGKPSKYIKKHIEVVFDDTEMLRLQGLMRCNSCNNPFPLSDTICPTCESSV